MNFYRFFGVFIFSFIIITGNTSFSAERSEIESVVEEYIKNHPEVIMESLRSYQEKQRKINDSEKLKQSLGSRFEVPIEGSPVFGPENASLTIIEFSDFQCPYCARSQSTIQQLMAKYKGDVRLVFKHMPLGFHAKARPAAIAAMAADKQGKFQEYKKKLMENQATWSKGNEKELFVTYAKELELDIDTFQKELNNIEFGKKIDSDIEDAKKVGITGTPSFVINGVLVRGAVPIENFETVIKALKSEK